MASTQHPDSNVLQKVLCHRPRREGQPRIEREVRAHGTVVIHDYGHGSGGWTMAWGAGAEAVGLLQPQDDASDIVIIGGGVAGLVAAYLLVKSGCTPKAIIAREFDNLTSHNAGGLFAHQSSNADATIQDRVNGWIPTSLPVYRQIALGEHPDFDGGARQISAYFADRATSDMEACVRAGVVAPAKDVIVDFQNGTQRTMVVYDDNIFIDTPGMMERLRTFLNHHNVTFIQQEITDLDQLPYSVVFNCTGLGAQALVPDDADLLMPVQGHLLLLKGQNPNDLDLYTLEVELGEKVTDSRLPATNLCYLFPKRMPNATYDEVGVLGGTFIKNADKNTPHEEEFDRVLQRARTFFGIA
jgi:D-amino-acid oxidase